MQNMRKCVVSYELVKIIKNCHELLSTGVLYEIKRKLANIPICKLVNAENVIFIDRHVDNVAKFFQPTCQNVNVMNTKTCRS